MALSSLLSKPCISLLSAKPSPDNKNNKISPTSFTLYRSLKSKQSRVTKPATLSKTHKLSWQQELKQAFQQPKSQNLQINNDSIDCNIDDIDDESFQKLVDKRCVDNVRMLIVDAVQSAQAGHPGMALGMADIGYYLYRHVMRYNPRDPKWFNRDRFVLSAGHGCLLQYVCLHLAGFESVQVLAFFSLNNFLCQFKLPIEVSIYIAENIVSIKYSMVLRLASPA
jgi:transketolase